MTIRYSDLSIEQLREKLGKLKEKAQNAEQLGEVSKVQVYERQLQIVASYMLNPDSFEAGVTYELKNDPGYKFYINYVNGIMAWGKRVNLLNEPFEEEEAIPLSLLGEKVK